MRITEDHSFHHNINPLIYLKCLLSEDMFPKVQFHYLYCICLWIQPNRFCIHKLIPGFMYPTVIHIALHVFVLGGYSKWCVSMSPCYYNIWCMDQPSTWFCGCTRSCWCHRRKCHLFCHTTYSEIYKIEVIHLKFTAAVMREVVVPIKRWHICYIKVCHEKPCFGLVINTVNFVLGIAQLFRINTFKLEFDFTLQHPSVQLSGW